MPAHEILGKWESFYVIVGSSAGALTGLQFVVIALVAEGGLRSSHRTISAFGTPTVVHFCSVLFVSAVLSAPWSALSSAARAIGLCGLFGVAYIALVIRRAHSQESYTPEASDWLWHAAIPLVGYASFLVSAFTLPTHAASSLFVIAGSALLLLYVGIHNAWDTVTYIAVRRGMPEQPTEESP